MMRNDQRDDDLAVMGRRKLLKLGLYSAPVILGTLTISRNAAAGTSGHFCNPDTPCGPSWPDEMGM
ncbi:MAG: hypothetical protein HYV09_06180 [Deltaproteobacteria bacterium]|nr:hypothetical protein [Deltaproteobacteria bacterium]